MAGTATEQCVGLGKPVVTLAGAGPQFDRRFALAQERLLGSPSIKLAEDVTDAAEKLAGLLLPCPDESALGLARRNGLERMGLPGASEKIADEVLRILACE